MDPGKFTTDCKPGFPYYFLEECMGCADRMSKESMGVQAYDFVNRPLGKRRGNVLSALPTRDQLFLDNVLRWSCL